MSDTSHDGRDEEGETAMDPETAATLTAAFESMADENPYYELVDVSVDAVDTGYLRMRVPYSEAVSAPGPTADGIHGGVIAATVDSAGMGSVMAQKGRPVPLVTEDLAVTFHRAADGALLVEGRVVSDGSTLVTSRVAAYLAAEYGDPDPAPVATGTTTARLFE